MQQHRRSHGRDQSTVGRTHASAPVFVRPDAYTTYPKSRWISGNTMGSRQFNLVRTHVSQMRSLDSEPESIDHLGYHLARVGDEVLVSKPGLVRECRRHKSNLGLKRSPPLGGC